MGITAAPSDWRHHVGSSTKQGRVGSAVNDTTRELGGALGIAALGSIATSVYRSSINVDGVPAEVADVMSESVGRCCLRGSRYRWRTGRRDRQRSRVSLHGCVHHHDARRGWHRHRRRTRRVLHEGRADLAGAGQQRSWLTKLSLLKGRVSYRKSRLPQLPTATSHCVSQSQGLGRSFCVFTVGPSSGISWRHQMPYSRPRATPLPPWMCGVMAIARSLTRLSGTR